MDAYRRLLARPHAMRLVTASTLGRIPVGMIPLTVILLVQRSTHSFAVAGAVNATYAIAAAVGAPLLGRLVDRIGQSTPLVTAALINAVGLAALLLAAQHQLAVPALLALAAAAGSARPPLAACMRALWPGLVGSRSEIATAYAFESVMVEVFAIVGPLLVTATVSASSPALALVVAISLSVAGVAAFARSPVARHWRAGPRPAGGPTIRGSAGIRTLLVANACFGVAFGTLTVTMPAFAAQFGRASDGGVVLAAMAFASMLSGLWYGIHRWRGSLRRRYLVLAAVFAAGLAPLPLAPSLPAMVLLAGIAGLGLAPLVACAYLAIDRLAPSGARTEAFTWYYSSTVTGSSMGSAVAGAIVGAIGVRPGIVTAFAFAAAGVLYAALRRSTLDLDEEPG
jgi:MFS family permease